MIWVGVGLGLNLLAVAIWAALFFGVFEGSKTEPTTPDTKEQKGPIKPGKKGARPPV